MRFERKGERSRKGCIVYVIAVPVLTLLFWIPLSAAITWLLPRAGVDPDIASNISVLYLLIIFASVCRWVWKDTQTAGRSASVTISPDRVDIDAGRRSTVLLETLEAVRLESHLDVLKVVLIPAKGRPQELPPDFASFAVVQKALEDSVVPVLQKRLDERIGAGGETTIGESGFRSLLRLLWGLLLIPLGLLAVASMGFIALGFSLLLGVPGRIRRSARGLGGPVVLRSGGLVRSSGALRKTVGWEELRAATNDEHGLVLQSRRAGTISISSHANNHLPVARWIVARLR
ncbi:MAG TPA: hypothetical protein VE981_06120 [Planctomycetota bacterium]|nr:hypothetical protein [Planctomycetota bacterium]